MLQQLELHEVYLMLLILFAKELLHCLKKHNRASVTKSLEKLNGFKF